MSPVFALTSFDKIFTTRVTKTFCRTKKLLSNIVQFQKNCTSLNVFVLEAEIIAALYTQIVARTHFTILPKVYDLVLAAQSIYLSIYRSPFLSNNRSPREALLF